MIKEQIKELLNKEYDHETQSIPRTKEFGLIMKSFIKSKGLKIKYIQSNWRDVLAFIEDTRGNLIYMHCYYINVLVGNNILIRTAKHIKDFTGGSNNYTSLDNFVEDIEKLWGK